jgi:hypothetical protein
MRTLNELREEINEADIDLTKGKLYVTRIIRPDASPVDNVNKFAYADDDYEEVQIYERIPDDILKQKRIDELKRMLSDTDYVVLKIAEGVATPEEYADVIANRKEWRKEINTLEGPAEM